MKRLGTLLAGAALIVGTGVLASARADDDTESVTLFTAAIHGNGFHSNTLNVSRRPLLIAMSIIDGNGNVISPVPVPNPKTPPGVNASNDLEPAPDTGAYCKVQVSGQTIPMTSEWS
jgi:hypothetical protein